MADLAGIAPMGDVVMAEARRPREYKTKGLKSRDWCFTLNNYTPEDLIRAKNSITNFNIRYIGWGLEVGKRKGTPHMQGHIYCDNARALGGLLDIFQKRAKWFMCKGTFEQNVTYCSKQGNYKFFGDPPQQGKRSDLRHVAEVLQSTRSFSTACTFVPEATIKYHNNMQKLHGYYWNKKDYSFKPKRVIWLYGKAGLGKNRRVYQAINEEKRPFFVKSASMGPWFDTYEGEPIAFFDEIRANIPFANLLEVLDAYGCTVPVKGTSMFFKPDTIYITSPEPPYNLWYNVSDDHMKQLYRRITFIKRVEHESEVIDLNQVDDPMAIQMNGAVLSERQNFMLNGRPADARRPTAAQPADV